MKCRSDLLYSTPNKTFIERLKSICLGRNYWKKGRKGRKWGEGRERKRGKKRILKDAGNLYPSKS